MNSIKSNGCENGVSAGLSEYAGDCANIAGTCEPSDTWLPQARSGFDLEDARRDLIAMRNRHGADTPKGHACSNANEQLKNLLAYERPAWATHERQTLSYMLKRQMDRLSS